MTRPLALAVVLVCALLGLTAPALAAPPAVEVVADPTRVSTTLGDEFSIETELTNTGATPTGQVLAHLNIVSLDDRAYVDPEDWSSDRSQDLSLAPGDSETLGWDIQAVNPGSFAVYVVVLSTAGGDDQLVVSRKVTVDVAERSTINAGGALKVVITVPVLLGVVALLTRLRVRRRH